MTAKEALRQVVEGLSEEEAGVWLARMGAMRRDNAPGNESALAQPAVRGDTDMDAILELVNEWTAAGPGDDEAVLLELEAALKIGGAVRLREPADW